MLVRDRGDASLAWPYVVPLGRGDETTLLHPAPGLLSGWWWGRGYGDRVNSEVACYGKCHGQNLLLQNVAPSLTLPMPIAIFSKNFLGGLALSGSSIKISPVIQQQLNNLSVPFLASNHEHSSSTVLVIS